MRRSGGDPGDGEGLFRHAVQLHRSGNRAEAEALYRRVLENDPRHADALHMMGALHLQAGDAVHGYALISAALALNPDLPEALGNLGSACLRLDKAGEALGHFDKSLELAPGNAAVLNNRGNALRALGRRDEALASYRDALASRPEYPMALNNVGAVLHEMGRDAEALLAYEQALALRPDFPLALNNCGVAHDTCGRHEESLAYFDKALALQPDFAEAAKNLGRALHALGRDAEAVASYDRALAIRPDYAEAWHNRGNALQGANRHAEAMLSYDRALAQRPGYSAARFGLGVAQLCLGDFEAGLQNYEARLVCRGTPADREFAQPRWTGEGELRGARLLLWSEQGLGDTLQFCRYVPLLASRGARIVLSVQPGLVSLLRSLDGVGELHAQGAPLPEHDIHCPLMSLPLALRTRLESIPANVPYLAAEQAKVEAWRRRIGAGGAGPKIGLVCAGNPRLADDRSRSMPLRYAAPLLDLGAQVFLLQPMVRDDDGPFLSATPDIVNLGPELADFTETAAAIACMDLVVSVDTAVAHLAGALGKPVWVLLPFSPDWRWLLGRDDSPWYPPARLFRQAAAGDWQTTMSALAAAYRGMH